MKTYLFYLLLLGGFFLGSCLAEQTNPLVLSGTCADGIMNQDEEAIDCGGVCKECNVIVPIEAPCKATLSNNVITIDGINATIADEYYGCTKEANYYKLHIMHNTKDVVIEIYETTLPKINTRYPLTNWFSSQPGYASIRLTDFFNYNSNSGELYLSYDQGKWIVEVCSVNLIGTEHIFTFSGRILCDW